MAQAQAQRLRGVDVYHGDGAVDWAAVYAAGAQFAYVKATQGLDYVDSTFRRNVTQARAAGLYVGAYHFLRQNDSGADQAAKFLETVGDMTGMLVPALDLETYLTEPWTLSADETVDKALAFIKQVQETIGRGCVVYTYPSFITEHVKKARRAKVLGGYPLWIASYPHSGQDTGAPNIPAVWKSWAFWQYTASGRFAGCPNKGDTDLNVTSLDRAGLEKLVVR